MKIPEKYKSKPRNALILRWFAYVFLGVKLLIIHDDHDDMTQNPRREKLLLAIRMSSPECNGVGVSLFNAIMQVEQPSKNCRQHHFALWNGSF